MYQKKYQMLQNETSPHQKIRSNSSLSMYVIKPDISSHTMEGGGNTNTIQP